MKNNITLYTINCPKCKILKDKLDEKHIDYSLVFDVETMLAKGFQTVPKLEIDGNILDFPKAIQWVNQYNCQ